MFEFFQNSNYIIIYKITNNKQQRNTINKKSKTL